MYKKKYARLLVFTVIFSSMLLTGAERRCARTRKMDLIKKRQDPSLLLLENHKRRKVLKEGKKEEILTMLNAYFDNLSFEDVKKQDNDLIIPTLPALIPIEREEEKVVGVKKAQ